jgi:hypothetical protein
MLPSESFTVASQLSPEDLIQRLPADATDWNESRLSESARAAGMYGFAFDLKGRVFRLRPKMAARGHYAPVYHGTVLAVDSGSRIDGAFRFGRATFALLVLWLSGAALTALLAVGGLSPSVSIFGALVAWAVAVGLVVLCALWVAFVLSYAWGRRGLARDETQPRWSEWPSRSRRRAV